MRITRSGDARLIKQLPRITSGPRPSSARRALGLAASASWNSHAYSRPHSRTAGKNLKRVRSQPRGRIERASLYLPRFGEYEFNAETPVLPCRRLGNRLGLWAIFIAYVASGFDTGQWWEFNESAMLSTSPLFKR